MPTVPRRDPASVEGLKPLPDVQYSPSSANAETFGGGASLERVGAEVKGLGDIGVKLAISQQDAADKAIAQQYDVLAVKRKNELMNDVALKYQGQKSLEASDYVNRSWADFSEEQKKSMPNDRVKELFDKRSVLYYGQIDNYVQGRVSTEITQLQEANSKAEREVTIQDSALHWPNPKIQEMNMAKLKGNVDLWAEQNGVPKGSPVYDAMLKGTMSDLHKAKIDRMLSEGADDHAKEYFKKHKGEFSDSKEAEAYGTHIEQQSKQIASEKKAALQAVYDQTNRDVTLRSFKGDVVLSEVQRLYRDGQMSESDYNSWENKLTNPDYKQLRARLGIPGADAQRRSDSGVFNNIRQAQINQTMTRGELDRAIRDNEGTKLMTDDAQWLLDQNKGIPPSKDELLADTQANRIQAFGETYFKTHLAGVPLLGNMSKEAKKKDIDNLVKEFNRRVVDEKATGDKITEIANKMIEEKVKRDDPALAGYEALPDITIDADHRVRTIFPGPTANKKKFKLRGVLTRESADTTVKPPEKKK